MSKHIIRDVSLTNGAGVLSSTPLQTVRATLIASASNSGTIYLKSSGSTRGLGIKAGERVDLFDADLSEFTLSGATSDNLGFMYVR